MNVWLMKTFQDWAQRFMEGDSPYVALDEPGVDLNYGELSEAKKSKLFKDLDASSEKKRRWGLIRKFFDRFYRNVEVGDVLVLGTGRTTKFHVYAIVEIISDAYYVELPTSNASRHRRDVKILWMDEPFLVEEWGWARRLEILDTTDRLKEFINVYTKLNK